MRRWSRCAVVVLFTTLMLVSSAPVAAAPAVQTPLQASSISLSVVPGRLPADGGQYSALFVTVIDNKSLPSIALVDMIVQLSSDQTSIATVPLSVTIRAGQSYAIAEITTTVSSGLATITASAAGLSSDTASVITLAPTGYPSHIKVFASPATFVARPSNQQQLGTLIVGLFDDTGLPAKAVTPTAVQLSSSSTEVASLGQNTITIASGQVFASGTFSTSFIPGKATIIGSLSTFVSGAAQVTVVGPSPFRLNLFAQPDKIATSSSGRLVLSLSDASGNPARANKTIIASIVSSKPSAITPNATATIPAGQIYTVVGYTSGASACNESNQCHAIVTAVYQGLASSSVTMTTYKSAGSPFALKVFLAPTTVLADNSVYHSILFSAVNKTGFPVNVASGISPVLVASSDSDVGTVLLGLTGAIPSCGSGVQCNWGTLDFQSTFASGQTTIVAAANGVEPDREQITSFGPVPTQLALRGVPGTIPADGNGYQSLEVSLADGSGNPAIAAQDTVVQLFSTTPDVIHPIPFATIPRGSTSTLVSLQTALIAGKANITASSGGLQSDSVPVRSIIPAPSQLQILVSPDKSVLTADGGFPVFVVQLQDSAGNPARARQDTNVFIASSKSSVVATTVTLTIPAGKDFVEQTLPIANAGSSALTATSTGLQSSDVDFTVIAFPLTVSLATDPRGFIYSNETAQFTASFTFLGIRLKNLNVTWSAIRGTMSPSTTITGAAGTSSSRFVPSSTGLGNITATTFSSATGPISVSRVLSIFPVAQKPPPSVVDQILRYWYLLIIVAAAVVIAGIYVFRLRSRKKRAEIEAEFETV